MKYIVIYQSRDDGDQWRLLWGTSDFDNSEDALREMRELAPTHQHLRFEMHPIDDHLLSAMQRDAERW